MPGKEQVLGRSSEVPGSANSTKSSLLGKIRIATKPSRIRAGKYGWLRIWWFRTTDMSFVSNLRKKRISAREFAVRSLHHQIVEPRLSLKEIRSWPDDLLLDVLSKLLKRSYGSGDAKLPSCTTAPMFRDMLVERCARSERAAQDLALSVRQQMEELGKAWAGGCAQMMEDWGKVWAENQARMIESFRVIQEMARQETRTARALFESAKGMTDFIQDLPDIAELAAEYEKAVRGENALAASGFAFAIDIWDVASLAELSAVPPRVAPAIVTKKVLAATRAPEFIEEFEALLQNSAVLRRRARIVARALQAHQAGDYYLAIPAFLAQLEGVWGDAMILRNLAVRRGSKLYERRVQSKGGEGRSSKGHELKGLDRKVKHSKFRHHPSLASVTGFCVSQLVGDRNRIMHGVSTSYGTAKLSSQVIFALLLISVAVREFEGRKGTT